ncbi:nuclease-related domain-containing DEAD/DEAH box helicase [Anabaena sp. UHCC 0451]|uniref:nuclease-related domain-containing DEAD/DEAH box helicase n=1 Tax=Anabaena sp. UHCC 0451 TaxID=2055235 RepID=UPI002B1FA686|nr:3'-5' exonuclease [Anabaena sp. UHCC 0451]MEA5576053.1 3'-5' exonuclease [Anabaena sp. UHCC 0451]
MAIMIPPSLPKKASEGEKRIYNILKNKLSDNFYVWYEPRIDGRYPDFIILSPDFGLLVIEVKGWYLKHILKASYDSFEIENNQNDLETIEKQKSPLRQGKDYLDKLLNLLKKSRVLTNQSGKYQGSLCFPIGVGAVMSNLTYEQADKNNLTDVLPIKSVIYRDELLTWEKDDIQEKTIIQRFQEMFGINFVFSPLTPDQISTIKGIIYPEIVIRQEKATLKSVNSEFSILPSDIILTTLDSKQESLAKSIGDGHRIFFGVSGSGKTLLLISRAKYLINQNHNARILILCFNVCLAAYIKSVFHQDSQNKHYQNIEVRNFDDWAKSVLGRLPSQVQGNRDEYTGKIVIDKLSEYSLEQKWDAIFIDEAHTFVPIWFQCCVNALKDSENGDLMIVADGNQSLYKRSNFKWTDVGIKAQGRTISKKFDLDKNYRNTHQILSSALNVLNRVSDLVEPLEDDDITFPLVKPDLALRQGDKPKIYISSTPDEQEKSIISTIHSLKLLNIDNRDIAILYRQAGQEYLQRLNGIIQQLNHQGISTYWVNQNDNSKRQYNREREGVRIITMLSSLGLEFKAVLLIWLEQFDDSIGKKDAEILARRQIYVAMTRAQEYLSLYINNQSKLTSELKNNLNFDIFN